MPATNGNLNQTSDLPANKSPLRFVPGLLLFRGYQRKWLMPDLFAGVTVCIVMIPSVIAYAGIMGLRPEHGLYAALVPLLIYAIFGSSRQMVVGPDIAISLLIANSIGPLAGGDPTRAAALAAAMAGLSGLILVLGAGAKIGAVADFLSKPVLVGYMTGAALILMASQVNKLCGVELKNNDFFPRLLEFCSRAHQAHPPTVAFGVALLAFLFMLRRVAPKVPAALAGCVVAILAGHLLGLEKVGVAMVGAFPRGLPSFEVPDLNWHDLHLLLPGAFGIALLTYTEGILLARAFAAKNGYEVNPNQELVALGLADLGAAFSQGFAITGSQARTTINDNVGGRTQLAGWVAAGTLTLFLLFLTPLLAKLPVAALAAILIYAGFTLIEFDVMKRIYRYYPRSAAVAAVTTFGVLAAGVVPGILIGVALSLLGLINRVSHPPDAVLREVPGSGFHDLGNGTKETLPGLIAYRFYAPLLFSNASHFMQRVRGLVAASPSVRWFLLDAQAITDIDVTAAETLHMLNQELRAKGILLKVAHANPPLRAILFKTGLADELDKNSFYPSVHECIDAFRAAETGRK
jgi:SulP family sulfate permease